MKKVLLLITLTLAAMLGLRAQEIQVGSGWHTSSILPHNQSVKYSVSQQIYTASEIGMACNISGLKFYKSYGVDCERNIKVFMKHVSKDAFVSNTDWVSVSNDDLVYEGTYHANVTWPAITFDTPFEYNGNDNLLICFWDSSELTGYCSYYTYYVSNRNLYAANNNAEFNLENLASYNGNRGFYNNIVRLTIALNGVDLSITPNPIDLGNRPIGAWTQPKTVTLTNNGSNATLTNMSFTNNAFTVGGIELPTDLNWSQSTTFNVSLDADEAGSHEAQLAIAYQERGVALFSVSATAYTPVCPDVWELAQPVNSFPFTDTPANLYDNYALPGTAEDGPDAVYALSFATDVLLNAGITSGENGKVALYTADFNGEGGPMASNNYTGPRSGRDATPDNQISNMTVPAGDYYLAASSTTEGFTVEINTQTIPLPVAATNPTPTDGQTNVNPNNLTLRWHLGDYTTEYQVLIGLSYFPNQVLVDWTSDLAESFTLTETLLNNRNYFWRVNERNSSGTTTGTIWGFTTSLVAPTGLVAAETKIYEGENAELSWNAVSDGSVQGYNIYQMAGNSWNWNNAVKINETPITETQYTVSDLAYSMVGYKFCVRAAYDVGESGNSNQVIVYVSGTGTISGHVYEQDETTPIADATVTVSGNDEHGRAREYTFVTDSEGAYNGTLYVGTNYTAKANKDGYQEGTHSGSVRIQHDTNTPDVDIYLTETYYQVGSVIAEYYPDVTDPESPYVKISWSWEGGLTPQAQPGWMTYSNDVYYGNVGSWGNSAQWGYKWPANYLQDYAGFSLTKVSMYSDYNGYTGGNYQCTIYAGEDTPTTPLSSISVNVQNNQGAYQEFDLTDPVEITGNETLWMIWQSPQGIQYPAPFCTVHDLYFNGSWWNGTGSWGQLNNIGYGAWMMKAYATNRSGRSMELMCADVRPIQNSVEVLPFVPSPYFGDPQVTYTIKPDLKAKEKDRSFQYFSVYRTDCYNDGPYTEENTVLLASNLTDTTYIDVNWPEAEPGVYKWGVEAHYAGNRSSGIVWNETQVNHLPQEPIVIQKAFEGEYPRTAGPSPYPTYIPDTNLLIKGDRPFGQRATAMQSFGASDQRFYHWNFPDTESLQQVGESSNRIMNSIEKVGDTYYYSNADFHEFGIIDVETGQRTVIATGVPYHCIAYNPVDGQLYGASLQPGRLYTIDLATGEATFVRMLDGVSVLTMAINNDGIVLWCELCQGDDCEAYIYARDIATNQLVAAFQGPTSAGYGYAQSMICDRETNTFYWACYRCDWSGNWSAPLVEVDIVSRTCNILGFFARETCGFCIAPETPSVGGNSVWSNCLAKGMSLGENEVSINVLLNSADSPEGTTVSFTNYNENEQENYPVEDITLDETGYYAWDSFRKGNYQVRVSKDGYQGITDSVGIWEATDLRYVLTEKLNLIENLYVSHTGWAMWEEPNVASNGTWLHYDNGVFATAFGFSSVSTNINWGIMFPAEDMAQYDGFMLPKVALFDYQSGQYTAKIYEGGDNAPETLIATQEIQLTGTHQIQEYELESPPTIDGSKNLWITINFEGYGYPIAAGYNTGSPNGRWYSIDGNTWQEHFAWNAWTGQYEYFTWILRGFVTDERGRSIELGSKQNEGERHLENYKVMCTSIDGEPIFNADTEHTFCQLETENLVEGETYLCRVAPMYTTGLGTWTETTWVYEPCENYEGTTNGVTIEDEVISWDYPGGSSPGPGGASTFTVDFEGGLPEGWTVIDGNNDGYTWCLTSAVPSTWSYYNGMSLDWYRSGSNAIVSGSYINGVGALSPDEYLVSPQVTLANGSTFSFWAAATDASYPADHFGVFVSDNGTSGWTMVNEWTLTAKIGGKAGDPYASRDGNGNRLGNWYQYSVDLSDYAGQKYIAIRHFNCNDQYIMCVDDISLSSAKGESNRAMWDEIGTIICSSPYQYGVATDGNFIYTSAWSGNAGFMFCKYDMDGNFIESFSISGCGYCRDITYDGTYFYGVACSSTVYCIDLANRTLVNTFTSTYGAMRAIGYDAVRDGFWVVGNWSGNLALIDRYGNVQQTGPEPAGCSGLACYTDDDGVDHVLLHCQPSGQGSDQIDDYNISTNTITSNLHSILTAGTSGGMHIADYNGTYACYASVQENPNVIHIFDLDVSSPAPIPGGDTDCLGAMIFHDGEWEAFVPYPTHTYPYGFAGEYCVRIVHDGPMDGTYYSMSCPECVNVECAAGEPISGEYIYNSANDFGALITWAASSHNSIVGYNIYRSTDNSNYTLIGSVEADATEYFDQVEAGNYYYQVRALHDTGCESAPAPSADDPILDYVYVGVTSVAENEGNIAIYPNPTNGKVKIVAQGMNHVTVVSVLGQMVYDADVTADQVDLDMGHYNTGVYMIRIATEDGMIAVKRVTVLR